MTSKSSCTRVVLHPSCKTTFPIPSLVHENPGRVCKKTGFSTLLPPPPPLHQAILNQSTKNQIQTENRGTMEIKINNNISLSVWKVLSCWLSAWAFLLYSVLTVCVPFLYGVGGRKWNSILSIPDHCLFIYLTVSGHFPWVSGTGF